MSDIDKIQKLMNPTKNKNQAIDAVSKGMNVSKEVATKMVDQVLKDSIKKESKMSKYKEYLTEIKKPTYYNLDRGVYILGDKKQDRDYEMKNNFPNAESVLSNTKEASKYVEKMNSK